MRYDRATLAARTAGKRVGARPSTNRPATDLTTRTATIVKPSGVGIRRRKVSMTGAQRNSEGRRSEWNASPYYRNGVTVDARWSATVQS